MDNVESELAELRSALQRANERFEILDKRLAYSLDGSNEDKIVVNNERGSLDLIGRATNYLHWGRLKSQTMDSGNGLFSDSCWNMCLDIYICGLKEERVTVSAIAHSSGIPMTTAMRYINVMVQQGLIEKTPNPADNRMIFVSLSSDCMEKIEKLLTSSPL
ncbi:MarR family transcriptional regulator [uncultured Parasphingorhabdus sp.]|uniref:MarR family transcriptional regulator n=1 Tax=uncultured Parasphingorhabdus sp. TaxID=2709694 RepID=UPI0030D945D5|tara:strand:- start:90404 stop:90886 length:483 start_codon:yes stop_codon:yes gene_type:complete